MQKIGKIYFMTMSFGMLVSLENFNEILSVSHCKWVNFKCQVIRNHISLNTLLIVLN